MSDEDYEAGIEQERAHRFGSKYEGYASDPMGAGGRHSYDMPQYMIRVVENKIADKYGAQRPHNIDAWGRKIKATLHNTQLRLSDFVNRYGSKAKSVFGAVLGKIHREHESPAPPAKALSPVIVHTAHRTVPRTKTAQREAEAEAIA